MVPTVFSHVMVTVPFVVAAEIILGSSSPTGPKQLAVLETVRVWQVSVPFAVTVSVAGSVPEATV